ncbi:MAG: hypothetical protein HYZ37_08650 [Candidatus Solibacter usitatus]|nr:hypothetical protein [Candidatus Solibacter usitatus]
MDCGDTFLMPAPGGMATPHLWIVITPPDLKSNLCAIVSVTTLRNSKDQTVILRIGDHPFIRHDSTIFYGDAMIVDARRLDAEIAAGLALGREKCPVATLKLVQEGVTASPFTRPKILRFCREHWRR